MIEAPSDLHRLKRRAGRFAANLRPHHIAVVAVLSAVGLGVVAARTMALPGPEPISDDDRMHIQVVAPVEPAITPGSVMEVGDLVEGFEYRRPPPAVIEAADYAPYDDEVFEAPAPRPVQRRDDDTEMTSAPPAFAAPPEARRDGRADRWFGFDAPERDYRAEREARRARIDARMERERERDRRDVRWYRSDGEPVGDDGRYDRRQRDEDPGDLRG